MVIFPICFCGVKFYVILQNYDKSYIAPKSYKDTDEDSRCPVKKQHQSGEAPGNQAGWHDKQHHHKRI